MDENKELTDRLYTCEVCGGIFCQPEAWSDEDAAEEAQRLFGVIHASKDPKMACVCDDCFKAFFKHAGGEPFPIPNTDTKN